MHDGELVIETEELADELQSVEDSDVQRAQDEYDGAMDIDEEDKEVDDKTDECKVDKFAEVEFYDGNGDGGESI
jgi:hypothetical protein